MEVHICSKLHFVIMMTVYSYGPLGHWFFFFEHKVFLLEVSVSS